MRRLRFVKSGLWQCESKFFAALLCAPLRAHASSSALSLLAGLRVNACKCAPAPRTLV